MTPEIRRAALRMAAKTALILSLNGCGGGAATPPPVANATGDQPPAPAASCEQHLSSLAVVKRDALAPDDPLAKRNDVYGAFADIVARTSARTQQCCHEELDKQGARAAHRWACCSALGPTDGTGIACTPWGPPCPPEMA